MEKRDIIVIAIAIIIVLIMALYIKPFVTGKEVKVIPDELSDLFGGNKTQSADNNTSVDNTTGSLYNNTSIYGNYTGTTNISSNFTSVTMNATETPTPAPTWNGSIPEEIGFAKNNTGNWISSRPYPQEPLPEYDPKHPNESFQPYSNLASPVVRKTYTSFSGKYSETTNPIPVPGGSWEIVYTVDVEKDLQNPDYTSGEEVYASKDSDKKIKLGSGTTSAVNPEFVITVKDSDTGETLRKISPPGGINPSLWTSGTGTSDIATSDSGTPENWTNKERTDETSGEYKDPRPWREEFFEGNRSVSLDILARNLKSYKVDIMAQAPQPTPNVTPTQETMTSMMTDVVRYYISYYNGNISDPNTYYSLTDLLSSGTKAKYQNQVIYKTLRDMKDAGINITGFTPQNSFVRGTEGSLKGDVSWTIRDGSSRTTTMDIPFVSDDGYIKMNDLIQLRY